MSTQNIIRLPSRYAPNGEKDSGGFSDVIFCTDAHLDRTVAIKYIKDQTDKDRLQDEISALLQLRSKHVVQTYDIITEAGELTGIVLEFIEGNNIFEDKFRTSSPENCLKVLWQITVGISDIHDAGLIHRDIKPSNIKIDNEGIVKILDFGLSREEGDDAETRGFVGTPVFAAPELSPSSASTIKFTNAVDVFAFGMLAFILSHKTVPKTSLFKPPYSKSIFDNSLLVDHDEIVDCLVSCLNSDPTQRPSIQEVKDIVSKYLLLEQHQALLVINSSDVHVLNSKKRRASISRKNVGKFEIAYDGLNFVFNHVEGEVFMNLRQVNTDDILSGSCVVAIGKEERGRDRSFITFDLSNPEVVL